MHLLYLLAALHLAQRWNLVYNAFIVYGASADSTFNYLTYQPLWSRMIGVVTIVVNTLVANCILVCNCKSAVVAL